MQPKDLSEIHEQITTMFPWPKTESEWDQYRLSKDQVDFFNENGYLAGIKMLNDEQIDFLRKDVMELADPAHPGNALFYEYNSNESTDPQTILFHALGAWRITPGLHDVLWNPAFVMAASQLLGNKPVRFWHDQLFYKPAKRGGVVAWHQDYSYWTRTKPIAHITCWTALDDATLENGCLFFILGSHKTTKLSLAGIGKNIGDIFKQYPEFKSTKPFAATMKAGNCSFHNGLTIHGAHANMTPGFRRAMTCAYMPDGNTFNGTRNILSDEQMARLKVGDLLNDGKQNPLIYSKVNALV